MRSKPNYELKAKVIQNGMAKKQREISLTFFKHYQESQIKALTGEDIEQWKPMTIEQAILLNDMFQEEFPEEYQECKRVNHAYYHRTKRLSNKIQEMLLSGQCIFLTLTFTDDVFSTTNEDTRKRYVKRYLKSVSSQYVANIDYGAINEREHYHAVIIAENIDYKLWHKYGAIKGEKVIIEDATSKRLAKYVAKLTNHAIKNTTRRNAVIYSR